MPTERSEQGPANDGEGLAAELDAAFRSGQVQRTIGALVNRAVDGRLKRPGFRKLVREIVEEALAERGL